MTLAYRWLVHEDVGTLTLVQLGMLAGVGYAWMTYAQDRLSMSATGVRVRGAVIASLVRWERLRSAVADDDSLVLRVVDPSDALIVHQHHQLGRFLPGAATPVDAARQIEMSRPGPTTLRKGGVTYLPTPAVARRPHVARRGGCRRRAGVRGLRRRARARRGVGEPKDRSLSSG